MVAENNGVEHIPTKDNWEGFNWESQKSNGLIQKIEECCIDHGRCIDQGNG